jgi:hypothetical protein
MLLEARSWVKGNKHLESVAVNCAAHTSCCSLPQMQHPTHTTPSKQTGGLPVPVIYNREVRTDISLQTFALSMCGSAQF